MEFKLTVKRISDAYTEAENVAVLSELKLPSADKDGCSNLSFVKCELANYQSIYVSCEVTNFGLSLSVYENPNDPEKIKRLMTIGAEPIAERLYATFKIDDLTELHCLLSGT